MPIFCHAGEFSCHGFRLKSEFQSSYYFKLQHTTMSLVYGSSLESAAGSSAKMTSQAMEGSSDSANVTDSRLSGFSEVF